MAISLRRIGAIKEGEQVVGNRTRVKVAKNKLAAPFKETEFDIAYGRGISLAGELIDLGVEAGLIEKSGSWMSMGGERIGQGRDTALKYLLDHADVAQRIRAQLLEKAGAAIGSSVPRARNCTGVQVEDRKPAPAKVDRTQARSASAAAA